jgi:hypothetical protein
MSAIVKELANPRRRILPLNEKERIENKIELEKRDQRGDFPSDKATGNGGISREMKKYIIKNPEGFDESKEPHNVINMKRMEQVLKRGGRPSLTKAEVISLEKRMKVIENILRPMMVPVEDSRLSPSHQGGAVNSNFHRSANFMAKNEMMSSKFSTLAHELKNIRRILGKDDPQAGNLEYLRPKRGDMGSQ